MLISDWFTTGDYDRYRDISKEEVGKSLLVCKGGLSVPEHTCCECYRLAALLGTCCSQSTAVARTHMLFSFFKPKEENFSSFHSMYLTLAIMVTITQPGPGLYPMD